MTDNEIIKALEAWINDFVGKSTEFVLLCNLLDLIKRQKVEIEEQDEAIINALKHMGEIRAEAIKEFAERLKKEALIDSGYEVLLLGTIDHLAEEITTTEV